MKKKYVSLSFLLLVVGFFSSCIKEDDFALDDIKGINPVFAFPLINAELDLDNIVHLTGDRAGDNIHVDYDGDMVRLALYDTISQSFSSSEKKVHKKDLSGKIFILFEQEFDIELFELAIDGGIVFDTALFEIKARGRYSQEPTAPIVFDVRNLNVAFVSKDGTENNIPVHAQSPLSLTKNYERILHTNVGDLFSDLAAQKIRCSFEIEIDTSILGGNVVYPDDIDIAFYFGVAMNFKADITFSDTLAANLDFFGDLADKDSELNNINAKLYYKFENTFPVGLRVQVYFLNTQNQVVDSLFNGSFTVGAGNSGAPTITNRAFLGLSYEKLLKISKCPNIILNANLNTSNLMQTLTKRQRLKVSLSVEGQYTNFTLN